MKWFIGILFISCSHFSISQDTLPREKKVRSSVKLFTGAIIRETALFDFCLFAGSTSYAVAPVSRDYIIPFLQNENKMPNDPKYSAKSQYNDENFDSTVEGGIGFSVKIKTDRKILQRIKPRMSVMYSQREFFRYQENFSDSKTIDTLRFTNPQVPPVVIDSSIWGYKKYSFSSRTIFVEAGLNMDLFRFRYFNFYTGLLYSQGFGINNKFYFEEVEKFTIDKYPNEERGREMMILNNATVETIAGGSSSRISIPVGIQHRFSNRGRSSIGIFVEGRATYEIYRVKKELTVSKPGATILIGARFNFLPHR